MNKFDTSKLPFKKKNNLLEKCLLKLKTFRIRTLFVQTLSLYRRQQRRLENVNKNTQQKNIPWF